MPPTALSSIRRWLLSSPPAEWALNQLRELLIGAIKQGRVPKHIAFVMDGNRRYARTHRIETVEGHNLGFEALARILEVCYKSGVVHVTIYAFSIENFKRSKHEVDALMDMARIKLTQLSQHGELLDRYGARIRVLGQRDLLKPDVLEAIDRAADMTKHNDKTVLNVCFPYTSRDEITRAIRRTVEDFSTPLPEREPKAIFKQDRISKTILRTQPPNTLEVPPAAAQLPSPHSSTTSLSDIDSKDTDQHSISSASSLPSKSVSFHAPTYPPADTITSKALDANLYTSPSPPLDLLIRTSGVARLSDFMLWQCHQDTRIVFLDVLWPEFDLWGFLPVLWEWQWWGRKEKLLADDVVAS